MFPETRDVVYLMIRKESLLLYAQTAQKNAIGTVVIHEVMGLSTTILNAEQGDVHNCSLINFLAISNIRSCFFEVYF